MRIRLLTLMAGPQGNYFPGQILHLPDDVAQEFIDGGFAEAAPLNEVEKGTPAAGRETATRARRETRSRAKKQEEAD